VLDSGVTRMLLHRLVSELPYIYCGRKPVADTYADTRSLCFFRLLLMGRRCKACKTPPGCVPVSILPSVFFTVSCTCPDNARCYVLVQLLREVARATAVY